jgi:hypothetical protein
VRSAFGDQPSLGRGSVRLRCTWQVRRILEEYGFGYGPFYWVGSQAVRWLGVGRFGQNANGQFWSLGQCLRVAGARSRHRCMPEWRWEANHREGGAAS